jgi:hypothetical protein
MYAPGVKTCQNANLSVWGHYSSMEKVEKTIDLSEYGRRMFQRKDSPGELDALNIELAGWYAYYSSQIIPLKLSEASFWEEHKDIKAEKPKSDTYVRALWRISKDGHKMIELEETLKTIDKLMSTLRSSLHRYTVEYKSLKQF